MDIKFFDGLTAAPFTPMSKSDEIIFDQIGEYYSFLVKNRIVGAFINGSTGETASLTQQEKMKVTEAWVNASKESQFKIINLVGGTSYIQCIDNALHSESCGVDAIAIVAPYYFKPAGAKQLAEFCAVIAEKFRKCRSIFIIFQYLLV